jgi:hypothetical protein
MLPSRFERTDIGPNELTQYQTFNNDVDSKSTHSNPRTGPSDYGKQYLIGESKITESGIKAQPQYSFSRSLTHRTVDATNETTGSQGRNSNTKLRKISKEQNYVTLDNMSQSVSKYSCDPSRG